MLTRNPRAVAYSWHALIHRAGGEPDTWLPLCRYGDDGQTTPGLSVRPAADASWRALVTDLDGRIRWCPLSAWLPGDGAAADISLPVLFWGAGADTTGPPVSQRGDRIVFHADVLAATFFMLSRWEETVVRARDEHGRFPAQAAVATRAGFLDLPVVDWYGIVLRAWMRRLRPGWQPSRTSFRILLSHDVDALRPYRGPLGAARAVGSRLLRQRTPSGAWQALNDAARQLLAPRTTSTYRHLRLLVALSRRHRLHSAFYFMTATPTPRDNDYRLASPLGRRALALVRNAGFEVGFHPGYDTFDNPELLLLQKRRLDALLPPVAYGGRQHYLRFEVPTTWRHWERAGLAYDSTLGYAEAEGFRAGTCHPYAPFDVDENRVLRLQEVPLVVMDRTIMGYRGMTATAGVERMLALATRCRAVDGTFTLLWHNTPLTPQTAPWWAAYPDLVAALGRMQREADEEA